MKKSLFFFAAAALALTACSNDDATQQVKEVAAPQAVMFDTYVPNATRAGGYGVQTTSTLQDTGKGFGVFAVKSDDATYAATQTTDFMWNEHVTYSTSAWTYSPVKYWPNETGTDSQSANAESNHIDVLSFFAYAPYVEGKAASANTYDGKLADSYSITYSAVPTYTDPGVSSTSTGIVALGSNADATNDPYVWYIASPIPSESVDLLWGVAPAGGLDYVTVNPTYAHTTAAGVVPEGKPLLNLIKPSKDQKIKFLFKHALARLGVTVVAAIDQIAPGGDFENTDSDPAYTTSDATHVAVESIKITTGGTNKLFTKGCLNLNNATAGTANWTTPTAPVTDLILDESHELSKEILWKTNATTTLALTGFNGVDKTERKAIRTGGAAAGAEAYFMLIPSHEDTDIKVTITYYVFTADAKVAGGYAVTKNVIDKTVNIKKLTNNKAYNLKLILGLTSVKLDAEVADWEIDGGTEVNLPRNNE